MRSRLAAWAIGAVTVAWSLVVAGDGSDRGCARTGPAAEQHLEARLDRIERALDDDRFREALAELETAERYMRERRLSTGAGPSSEPSRSPEEGPARALRLDALRARALLRAGRVGPALSAAEHVAERSFDDGALENQDPRLARALARSAVVVGRIRAAQGETAEARAAFDRALSLAPDDPEVLYWSAGSRADRGAVAAMVERYLERAPDSDVDRVAGARARAAFLRALGDRALWRPDARPERETLALEPIRGRSARPSGFAIELRSGRGKAIPALFDTGSTGVYVVARLARRRGFEPLAADVAFGGGGGGRHETERGVLPELRIGGLRFTDVLATTSRRPLDPYSRYRALIGLEPFAGYRIRVDVARERVVLELGSSGPGRGVPYWTFAGQPLVLVRAHDGTPGLFVLDTGASRTVVSRSFATRVEGAVVEGGASLRGFGGRRDDAVRVDGIAITFGERTVEGPLVAVDLSLRSRMTGIEISGFLGLDLLGRGALSIDTVARRVWLEEARQSRDASHSSNRRAGTKEGSAATAASRSAIAEPVSPRRNR